MRQTDGGATLRAAPSTRTGSRTGRTGQPRTSARASHHFIPGHRIALPSAASASCPARPMEAASIMSGPSRMGRRVPRPVVQGIPHTGGPTIDQIVAGAIARPDRYQSLECSVDGGLDYEDVGTAIYRGAGLPLPAIDDPSVLFERLFSAQVDGVDPLLTRQASALDLVAERYARRASSGEDRQGLSAHRTGQDLERRLVGTSTAV